MGPLYLQATANPSSRNLPAHFGWVLPPIACLWQIGQTGFSTNSIFLKHLLQIYFPKTPHETQRLGKTKSRRSIALSDIINLRKRQFARESQVYMSNAN